MHVTGSLVTRPGQVHRNTCIVSVQSSPRNRKNMATQTNISGLSLLEIDSLEVTVLVDNEIDWMSTNPPCCIPETGGYLARKPAGLDETGTPILNFMNICCGAHGLSLLLVSEKVWS